MKCGTQNGRTTYQIKTHLSQPKTKIFKRNKTYSFNGTSELKLDTF